MNDMAKNLLLWLIIAVVLLTVFQSFNPRGTGTQDLAYSDFMDKVEHNAVAEVLVRNDNRTIEAKLKDGNSVRTTFLPTDENIAELQKKVDKMRVEPSDNGISLSVSIRITEPRRRRFSALSNKRTRSSASSSTSISLSRIRRKVP